MRESDFLTLMDAVGAEFGDEAVMHRSEPELHKSIIFKVTSVVAAAAVLLILTGSVALHLRGKDVPRVAYPQGAFAAAEAEKFTAEPQGAAHESALRYTADRIHIDDANPGTSFTSEHLETVAHSDLGFYSIGIPERDKLHRDGLCFTSYETGETVYLCARPICLHDGSDFCYATTEAYSFCSLAYWEDTLYALATKHTGNAEHPYSAVLLAIQPDGSGITEIAVLSETDYIECCEMIAHRGALWIHICAAHEVASANTVLDKDVSIHFSRSDLYHYDLTARELTWITGSSENATYANYDQINNLTGAGDYVYFQQKGGRGSLLEKGVYRADIRTGVIEKLPLYDQLIQFTADAETIWYTRRANTPSAETAGKHELHIISASDGTETTALIPLCNELRTDGEYLYVLDNGRNYLRYTRDGTLCGTIPKPAPTEEGGLTNYAVADGMLWSIRKYAYHGENEVRFWYGIATEIAWVRAEEAFTEGAAATHFCTLYANENSRTWEEASKPRSVGVEIE